LPCHALFVFCLLSLSLFPMERFFILAKIKSFLKKLKKNYKQGPILFCKGPHFKSRQKRQMHIFHICFGETYRHTSSTCSSI
jgi:hypothetical protein